MYHSNQCVISAFQYDGDLMSSDGRFYVPRWAEEAYKEGILAYSGSGDLFVRQMNQPYRTYIPAGNYIALLPNNSIIALDPVSFNFLFEKLPMEEEDDEQQA